MMGNAMWHLVAQSDTVSKGVLLALLIMSMICWTIFMYKIIIFRIKLKQLRNAIGNMANLKSFSQFIDHIPALQKTISGYFLTKNLQFLKTLLIHNELHPRNVEYLEQHVDQTIDEIVHAEESYLPFLATSASLAPLLGLFGTIWGLVHSFIRISEQQSADIATVAPGIAEALITTLAGLMVAIPAVAMFSLLSAYVKNIEKKLIKLADLFMRSAHQQFSATVTRPTHQQFNTPEIVE